MTRPRLIVSVVATVDGRVALNRDSRLLDLAARQRWESGWPPRWFAVVDSPLPLRTVDVQVGPHGSIWAHYEVAR